MWVRFPIWDRWGKLTRFWIVAESAFAAEKARWTSLPVLNPNEIKIIDPSGRTRFECDLSEYVAGLDSHHLLYSMLLTSYIGLVEEHGRDIIEYNITEKGLDYRNFPGMNTDIPARGAAEEYIKKQNVEQWGTRCLDVLGWSWSDVNCTQAAIVEVFAVRNIVAHGLENFNQTAANRIANVGGTSKRWTVGQPVILDRDTFGDYLHDLREFTRCLANASVQADVGAGTSVKEI